MLLRSFHQTRFDGIHPDIFDVLCVLVCVSDPVLVITLLPNLMVQVLLLRCAKGESSLDELHGFFERYQRRRCEDQVNVIAHEDELVNLKPLFGPILTKYVEEEIAQRVGLQHESSFPGRKRGKESTRLLRRN